MMKKAKIPSEEDIKSVMASMIGDAPISIKRMPTGDQNFVYAINTVESKYVLRMTGLHNKNKFEAAISWQKLLLPLSIPLAEFIRTDIDGDLSPFSSLLMVCLPGDDLINVYPKLLDKDKKNLSLEMIQIQALCSHLPEGKGFGILNSYEDLNYSHTWSAFLSNRLSFCRSEIEKTGVFSACYASKALGILKELEPNLNSIVARPFLWDASERNVLVKNGKITGIVDVDELCFGDPLLVIALTSTCLELEGYDTKYTEYWASNLELDNGAKQRLNFYKLFYAVAFMRKHGITTTNQKIIKFDIERLQNMYNRALADLNHDN